MVAPHCHPEELSMSFRACRGIAITQIVVIEILRRVAPQNDKEVVRDSYNDMWLPYL